MRISKNMAIVFFAVANTFIATRVFSQSAKDTTNLFHDDLLDRLIGKWDITSFAHGSPFTAGMEAEWVLNHQYLHIRFRGNETVPWFGVPMEYEEYIGYNHKKHRYVVIEASIQGAEDFEGFCYAYRTGDVLKLVQKINDSDTTVIQRMVWESGSGSWIIQSRPEVAGREGKIFLDMKLVKQQ